jgi:hypothetical protein
MPPAAPRTSFPIGRYLLYVLLAALALAALYFAVVINWSYSIGERAGWIQKFSKKGWLCKTWEGEIALVSMPGAIPEKFPFTVVDDEVADRINKSMGRRVTLHYEQKVGLPGSCFGETRYYVTRVLAVDEMQYGPGGAPVPMGPAGTPPPAGTVSPAGTPPPAGTTSPAGTPSPAAPSVPPPPALSPPADSSTVSAPGSGLSPGAVTPGLPAAPGLPATPGLPAAPAVPAPGAAPAARP